MIKPLTIRKITLNTLDKDELTKDDMWEILRNNRDRARTFGNLIISLSSIFLSLINGFFFFMYPQWVANGTNLIWILPLVIAVNCCFIFSMIQSVRSFYMLKPVGVFSKSRLILYLSSLYNKEVKYLRRAFRGLIAGILFSVILMGIMFFI